MQKILCKDDNATPGKTQNKALNKEVAVDFFLKLLLQLL